MVSALSAAIRLIRTERMETMLRATAQVKLATRPRWQD